MDYDVLPAPAPAMPENPICPECGYSHPIIPGERCPIKMAEGNKEDMVQPNDSKADIKPNETSDSGMTTITTWHPGVDQDVYNMLVGLGVKITARFDELGLNGKHKEHILPKFKLIVEQKVSDCVHTLLEDFKV